MSRAVRENSMPICARQLTFRSLAHLPFGAVVSLRELAAKIVRAYHGTMVPTYRTVMRARVALRVPAAALATGRMARLRRLLALLAVAATPVMATTMAFSRAGNDPAMPDEHLRDFVAVLSGYETCQSLEATHSLEALASRLTAEQAMLWRNPKKGLWRSVQGAHLALRRQGGG